MGGLFSVTFAAIKIVGVVINRSFLHEKLMRSMYYVMDQNIYTNHSSQLRPLNYNDTMDKLKNKWCCAKKKDSKRLH